MKKLFVPRGESVAYQTIHTDELVVKGYLEVDDDIRARHISGDGIIVAGSISADTLVMDEVEAGVVTADKIVAHRMTAPECRGKVILVTGYLGAERVKAGKLTVGLSDIREVEADEVVNLSGKRHSLLGALVLSWLRCKWMDLRRRSENEKPQDPEQASSDTTDTGDATSSAGSGIVDLRPSADVAAKWDPEDAEDFEFLRLKGLYSLLKDQGFALRLIPIDDPAKPGTGATAEKAA